MHRAARILAPLVFAALSPVLSAQTPAPTPPAAAGAPAAESKGTASDGRIFRLLDRVTREVDQVVIFKGRIPRALAVGRSPSGAFTLCMNCADEKAAPKEPPPAPAAKAEPAPKDAGGEEGPGGDLLLMDLKGLFNLSMEDGAFVYFNDDGFDADGRAYGAYLTAGPDTGLTRLGNLLLLSNRSKTAGCPFKVALRSWGTTYLAPVGDCDEAPAKATEADAAPGSLRDLTRDHLLPATDWAARHRTSFKFREGAAANPLTSALAVLAAGREDFLLVFDLRRLESAKASYFWMTQRPHRSVRLDENTVTVEGSGEGAEAYEPATFVEYPYLVVLGSYAKVRLAPSGGGPETVLSVGFCDECPP